MTYKTYENSVRNLGFMIGQQQTAGSDHASSYFFQLRQLRSVRQSFPFQTMKALAHCFISRRIDYCNTIIYGVSGAVLRYLQTFFQRSWPDGRCYAAHAGKRQHVTPILGDLHWLPVKEWILYKIGVLTIKCVRKTGSDYLVEMLARVSDVEGRSTFRSAVRGDSVIPRTTTATIGSRSFRVSDQLFGLNHQMI